MDIKTEKRLLSVLSAAMMLVPLTLIPLRTFDWAFESPFVEMILSCYSAFMIFGGIFTTVSYIGEKVQNSLMKVCLFVNGIYAAAGVMCLSIIIISKLA